MRICNMEHSPLVSVVCLSYNHENFVEQCLQSVVDQTYQNVEIIFVDNNSSDLSFEKGLAVLKKSSANYKAYKTEANLGIAGGANYGIQRSSAAKYISALASDDWWDERNLEEKVKYFEEHQEYGMVYGNGYNYDDEKKKATIYYKKPSVSGWVFKELLRAAEINPQGILYRHDVLKELNYFDPLAKVEDRDLWYRIARKYPIGYVHQPLTYYRVNHGSNISRNLSYMKEGNEYFFAKYEKDYPDEIKAARKRQYQYFAYSLSTHQPSFKSLGKILSHVQFNWPYLRSIAKCCLGIIGIRKK
jgi:glycosyltransferase involved in cell wall biosynthesis